MDESIQSKTKDKEPNASPEPSEPSAFHLNAIVVTFQHMKQKKTMNTIVLLDTPAYQHIQDLQTLNTQI